jgi:hypothetical protein
MKKKTSVKLGLSKTTVINLNIILQANVKGGAPTIGYTVLCTLGCSYGGGCPVSRTGIPGECCAQL